MAAPVKRATLDDLMRTEGQAELIGGRIVRFPPMAVGPGQIAGTLYFSLHDHARAVGVGEVGTATLAYTIPELPSGRESFSPDASYHLGPFPEDDMDFIPGPPTFAVEIRSKNDYGPAADAEMASKRDDYFEAGTQVVWDVDPRAETITCYRPGAAPVVFRRGDVGDAEPAVSGWRVAVDEVFGG